MAAMHSVAQPTALEATGVVVVAAEAALPHDVPSLLSACGPASGGVLVSDSRCLYCCEAEDLLEAPQLRHVSGLQAPDGGSGTGKEPAPPAGVHLVSLSPQQPLQPQLAAYGHGRQLSVVSLGQSLSEAAASIPGSEVGQLTAPDPLRWRGVSWQAGTQETTDHLVLAAVCQAEVRVVLVRTPPLAAGSSLTEVARLQPRVPCRSSLVHVAWAGAGASGRTLVVAWGRDLELLSWPAPSAAPGDPWGSSAVVRRAVLLGLPGPLRAVAQGPCGTVLATTDAVLSFSSAAAAGGDEGVAFRGSSDEAAAAASGGDGAVEEAVDLRGRFTGGEGGGGGGGEDGDGGLAGLMSISSLQGGGGGPGLSTTAAASAGLPSKLLLQSHAASSLAPSAGRLVLISPGWLHGRSSAGAAAGAAEAGPHAAPSRFNGGLQAPGGTGRFRSVIDLLVPKPDLLHVSGRLALVATTAGPPLLQALQVSEQHGLLHLASLSLLVPGVPLPAARLRGICCAAAVVPSEAAAGGGAAAAATVHVVALMGQLDGRASAPFTSLSRSGPASVRFAPLYASTHKLPAKLATLAMAGAHRGHGAAAHPIAAAASSGGSGGAQPAAAAVAVALPATAPPAAAAAAAAAAGNGGMPTPPPAPAPAASSPGLDASQQQQQQLLGQLAGLLSGLQAHMDGRLDRVEGALQRQGARLDVLEGRVGGLGELERTTGG